MNKRVFQMPSIFPKPEARNRVIVMTSVGQKSGFSVLMTDHLPDFTYGRRQSMLSSQTL